MNREEHTVPETHDCLPGADPDASRRIESAVQEFARVAVIINADDWGISTQATNRILDCLLHHSLSSASAMVFMADSERAAGLVREHHVDVGLHLNLTSPFSASQVPPALVAHHGRIARFLLRSRYAPMLFNPLLVSSFDYVAKAQMEEFERLYGAPPNRVDGHHHMHLSANVRRQKLIPQGVIMLRYFTFSTGEKGPVNRFYRGMLDRSLARRHRIPDYFFNLVPLEEERLRRILELAQHANVEIETHPEREQEYRFLMEDRLQRLGREVKVVRGYQLRQMAELVSGSEHAFHPPLTAVSLTSAATAPQSAPGVPHICVCICTYKRPEPLKRLLGVLNRQKTDGMFTFSIVVADNDEARSGEAAVKEMRALLSIPVKYCTEPQRGIARARNRVLANSEGEYVALIDDDEFPGEEWLLQLFLACRRYDVDGVLGPVKRHFYTEPPSWLKRSRLYDRPVNPTGMHVEWRKARTGNVLLKRAVFLGEEAPFRVEFKSGEDHDFFRRKVEQGRSFIWSADAIAYEVLPPARWKRSYYLRKALLHGGYAVLQPDCGAMSVIKSLIAIPLYTLGLPFALLTGQHRFMMLLIKLCEHTGKVLFLAGIRPIREEYVND